ncbi:MAG: hypothetical protein QOG85_2418, partial [Gaiellaceae bacterium]|nr:hypothetical protein [Gaiellaceae bacterium]
PAADGLAIGLIADGEIAASTAVLSVSFGMPEDVLSAYLGACGALPEASWYVSRVDDDLVATALGITIDGVTGVFNVATLPGHRGRGHGAALTARVVQDGFESGARLAFLQSSKLGHPVYRRLGFRDVEEYVLLTRPAAA